MAQTADRMLAGRYRLLSEIGRGGMGTVWWARDEALNREVAVKEMHLPQGLDDSARDNVFKRTHREALAASQLRHPGIVAVYDAVVEDGRPWLIMEYVSARSLEQVIMTAGPLPPHQVAEIGRQLLAALTAAHLAGILHRDVKPANVLLGTYGRVVLTDFGIATWDGATTLTQSGTFMGSPSYVAPEIARGERATPRSDLWSLGATLYAAVEGHPPYDRDSAMATLGALITEPPAPVRRAGELRPVIEGLLRKDPAKRMSAAAAEQRLRNVGGSGAWPAAETTLRRHPRDQPSRPRHGRRPSGDWFASRLTGVREAVRSPARSRSARFAVPALLAAGIAVAALVVGLTRESAAPVHEAAATPSVTPPEPTSSAARPPRRAVSPWSLPASLAGPGNGEPYQRVAKAAGTWPADVTGTLMLPRGDRRIGIAIVCRGAGAALLATEVRVGGRVHRVRRCDVLDAGARGPRVTTLDLPARYGRTAVRIRLRSAARTPPEGPIRWSAAAYAAPR